MKKRDTIKGCTWYPYLLAVCLICCGFLHLSCSRQSSRVANSIHHSLVDRGLDAFQKGHIEQALRLLEKAYVLFPENAEIVLHLGIIYDDYFDEQEESKAGHYYKKFLSMNPDSEKAKIVDTWIEQGGSGQQSSKVSGQVSQTGQQVPWEKRSYHSRLQQQRKFFEEQREQMRKKYVAEKGDLYNRIKRLEQSLEEVKKEDSSGGPVAGVDGVQDATEESRAVTVNRLLVQQQKGQIAKLSQERDTLNARFLAKEKIIENLNYELEETQETVKELKKENSTLMRDARAASKGKQEQITLLNSRMSGKGAQIEALEGQVKKLQSQKLKRDGVLRTLESEKQGLGRMLAQLRARGKEQALLQARQLEKNAGVSRILEKEKSYGIKLRRELEAVSALLEKRKQRIKEFEDQLVREREKKGKSQKQIQERQGIIDQLQADQQQREKRIAGLTGENASRKEMIHLLEGEIRSLRETLEKRQVQVSIAKDLNKKEVLPQKEDPKKLQSKRFFSASTKKKTQTKSKRSRRVIPKLRSYKVLRGETLSMIAGYSFIYRDKSQWRKIYNANRHKIKNPNVLTPGMVLVIPR